MGIRKHSRRANCVRGVTHVSYEHSIAKYDFDHFNQKLCLSSKECALPLLVHKSLAS